jgi:hypothetical protein
MPKTDLLTNNFSAGELSPDLDVRVDVNKYYSGCRKLENFVPMVEGGVTRVPGTYFLIETKDSSKKSKLVPFNYSTIQAYQLEFGNQYIRFYKDKGQILVDTTSIDFNPSISHYNGEHVKIGAYASFEFDADEHLYVCAPYGLANAGTLAVEFTTNTGDTLSVTAAGTTITVKLANSTPAKNAANLIQYKIRLLGTVNGISVAGFTVTENSVYAASRPIAASTAASFLVVHDNIYRCLVTIEDPAHDLVEFPITNITKANPGVVSATSHTFIIGDRVHILEVVGMTEVNDNEYNVGTTGVGTFQLSGVNTSAYTDYTSGGKVKSISPNINFFPPAEATKWVEVTVGNPVEIVTPYLEADLPKLSKTPQSADILYLFHPSYHPKKLIRHSHVDWELTDLAAIGTEGVAKVGAVGVAKSITFITRANPAVVTCREHGFHDGESVYINHVLGMLQVNGNIYTVSQPTTHTFKLLDTDSSGFDTFYVDSSGEKNGTAVKVVDLFNATGDYPSCGTFFEQRLCVGGFNNDPNKFKLSMSGEYEKFISDPTLDDGSIEFTLASSKVDRIRWMIGQQQLILGTAGGIWRVGASSTAEAFTQSNLDVKKLTSLGVLDVEPEMAISSVMWLTRMATTLRQLSYSIDSDQWIAPNMMRIAQHIALGVDRSHSGIASMAFQCEPIPILWCVRADGQLLGMTYESQEQVYAWFRIVTDGEFESVSVISNDNQEDEVWVIVKRTINGSTKRYIEYLMPYEWFSDIHDFFYLHSGLTWDGGASIPVTGINQAAPPVVTAVGHTLVNGNKVVISGVLGMTEVNITGTSTAYQVANANIVAGTFELQGQDSTTWGEYDSGGIVKKVTNSISGLSHLEAKSVDIVVDGANHGLEVVASGAIALDYYGNKIHVGLPYTSTIIPSKIHIGDVSNTLRNKKAKITRITCVFSKTIGGKYGSDETDLIEIPFTADTTPVLHTEDIPAEFPQCWVDAATLCVTQDQPMPMTLLGIVSRLHVED